ncbi:MAG TPA: SHOCT domain-containing protein, partial [Burkholderiales bacterium]|nr:SHOCT domain-containing protein [Burkholderiales bacterium]
MSVADEIAKLHDLLTRGALTPAEFEREKARLLEARPGPGAGLA